MEISAHDKRRLRGLADEGPKSTHRRTQLKRNELQLIKQVFVSRFKQRYAVLRLGRVQRSRSKNMLPVLMKIWVTKRLGC